VGSEENKKLKARGVGHLTLNIRLKIVPSILFLQYLHFLFCNITWIYGHYSYYSYV